jgi:TP901 family phage tail tape measure protein
MAVEKIVKTRFAANDKITKRFSLMEKAAARFGRNTEKSFKRANRAAKKFDLSSKSIIKGLGLAKGLQLAQQGLLSVTQQFIAFDKAALGATVRFKDIGPEAANFNEMLKKIQQSARDAGATTEFTAAQSAEALDFLARAGFTSAEAMGSLGTMINLATASGEDFATVANMSSDLLGSFGLNVDDTSQKIANLTRLNDVLVKAANSANVTIEDMFETLKIAAPIGTKMGQSLESLTAITAFLGGAGIKGSISATALKNAILNLTAPSSKAIGMIKGLGVEVDDGTGNMRKLNDILGDMAPELKKLGNIQAGKILNEIFGKRAIAGAINIANGTEAIIKMEDALKNAKGTAQLTADIMRTSLEAKLKTLASAATEFGFKIFSAFAGDARNGLDAMTESIRNLDVTGIVEELKVVIKFMGVLLRVAGAVAKAFDLIGKFIGTSIGRVVTANLFKGAGGEGFSLLDAFGGEGEERPERIAPNQQEAAARAEQAFSFRGRLDIAGAPEGSTIEVGPAPPGFDVAMLGQN